MSCCQPTWLHDVPSAGGDPARYPLQQFGFPSLPIYGQGRQGVFTEPLYLEKSERTDHTQLQSRTKLICPVLHQT